MPVLLRIFTSVNLLPLVGEEQGVYCITLCLLPYSEADRGQSEPPGSVRRCDELFLELCPGLSHRRYDARFPHTVSYHPLNYIET